MQTAQKILSALRMFFDKEARKYSTALTLKDHPDLDRFIARFLRDDEINETAFFLLEVNQSLIKRADEALRPELQKRLVPWLIRHVRTDLNSQHLRRILAMAAMHLTLDLRSPEWILQIARWYAAQFLPGVQVHSENETYRVHCVVQDQCVQAEGADLLEVLSRLHQGHFNGLQGLTVKGPRYHSPLAVRSGESCTVSHAEMLKSLDAFWAGVLTESERKRLGVWPRPHSSLQAEQAYPVSENADLICHHGRRYLHGVRKSNWGDVGFLFDHWWVDIPELRPVSVFGMQDQQAQAAQYGRLLLAQAVMLSACGPEIQFRMDRMLDKETAQPLFRLMWTCPEGTLCAFGDDMLKLVMQLVGDHLQDAALIKWVRL